MVKFTALRNGSGEERRVREVCTAGNLSVIVYEPSREDTEQILEWQDQLFEEGADGQMSVKVSDEQMIRLLYPLLTNLEGFDELKDEEIKDVTQNPSIALIQTTSVITQILIEVYKITILSIRRQMVEQDLEFETFKFNQQAAQKILTTVSANVDLDGIQTQTVETQKQIDELAERRHEKEIAIINEETQRFIEQAETQEVTQDKSVAEDKAKALSLIPSHGVENDSIPDEVLSRFNETFDLNIRKD